MVLSAIIDFKSNLLSSISISMIRSLLRWGLIFIKRSSVQTGLSPWSKVWIFVSTSLYSLFVSLLFLSITSGNSIFSLRSLFYLFSVMKSFQLTEHSSIFKIPQPFLFPGTKYIERSMTNLILYFLGSLFYWFWMFYNLWSRFIVSKC